MDSNTWSPFQSAAVRQVCKHMTEGELGRVTGRSLLYGVWVMATFAGPVGLLFLTTNLALRVVCIALMLVHLAVLPFWFQMQRRFLCSSGWAREQGMVPERLALFDLASF